MLLSLNRREILRTEQKIVRECAVRQPATELGDAWCGGNA